MNTSQYFEELIQAVENNGDVSVSGDVNVTNESLDVNILNETLEISGDVNATCSGTVAVSSLPSISGSVSVSNFPATQPVSIEDTVDISGSVTVSNFPSTQPVSIASSVAVTNSTLTKLDNAIDNSILPGVYVLKTADVDSAGDIRHYEWNQGNASAYTQRVCIANDDTNSKKIADSITGSDDTDRKMRVSIQNTSLPVTSFSSLGVTVGNSSIPVTSASTLNVNVTQWNGTTAQSGSGSFTGALRVNIASNDVVGLNLYRLLQEPRALYNLTSNTTMDVHIGGFSSSIIGTDWIVLPNNSSGSITIADVNCYQSNSTFSIITDASSDYVGFDGAQSLIYGTAFTVQSNVTAQSVSITSASTTVTPTSTALEVIEFYTGLDGQNSKNNINDIFIKNNSSKYIAMIPAGYGKGFPYYIVIPSAGTVFLEKLIVTNNEPSVAGRGMRVKIIVRSVLTSSVSTIAREYTVFSASVPTLQSVEFDLKNLLPIRPIWTSNATHTDYIMLAVKGDNEGGTGTTAGSAFLTAKLYRG